MSDLCSTSCKQMRITPPQISRVRCHCFIITICRIVEGYLAANDAVRKFVTSNLVMGGASSDHVSYMTCTKQ